jgi:hypothetical protein
MTVTFPQSPKANASVPVVADAQRDPTTATKVDRLVKCISCNQERTPNEMRELIHKHNKHCEVHLNKRVCHLCLPYIEACPECSEDEPVLKALREENARFEELRQIREATKCFHYSRRNGCFIGGGGCVFLIACAVTLTPLLGAGLVMLSK